MKKNHNFLVLGFYFKATKKLKSKLISFQNIN